MIYHEKEMYDFAYILTQSAGEKLKLERKHSTIEIREKTCQMDIVTEQDILIEKYLTESILEKYPEHAIIAEECYNEVAFINGSYTWIIDPIDGTTNYYRFGKDYAISLALYYGDIPIFGLVYDVANNIMHNAISDKKPIVNNFVGEKGKQLNKAVVAMSFRTIKDLNGMGADVFGLLSRVQAHRYLGCASLELCKVASGEYDLFISSNVYTWDVAAARVLIEHNGGHLITCKKENKNNSCAEKLYAVAFRSPSLWEETLNLFPSKVKNALGYCNV